MVERTPAVRGGNVVTNDQANAIDLDRVRKLAIWHLNPDVCSTDQTREMALLMLAAHGEIERLRALVVSLKRDLNDEIREDQRVARGALVEWAEREERER